MAIDDSRWTFFLQPTGKVDVLARVTKIGEETFRIDTDRGYGDVLEAAAQPLQDPREGNV